MFDILILKGKKDSTRTIHRHGWKKRRRSLRWTISAGYRSKRMEKGNFEFLVDHRGRNRGRDVTDRWKVDGRRITELHGLGNDNGRDKYLSRLGRGSVLRGIRADSYERKTLWVVTKVKSRGWGTLWIEVKG